MRIISIYRQILFNILFPIILGILVLGYFTYRNTVNIFNIHSETEQNFIYDEIRSFIGLQFVALSIIEEPMDKLLEDYSNQLVNNTFLNTYNIENADLIAIQQKLGMDSKNFDLYIINRDGVVVNTTFRDDLYFNFFSFSQAHKNYLLSVFNNKKFDSPKFFFEHKTKRYKKYSYIPTLDGRYIIEIGLYNNQADKIYDYMVSHLDKIPDKKSNLVSVDLFLLASGKPYPLNLRREFLPEHADLIPELIKNKEASASYNNGDGQNISYTYFFLPDTTDKIFEGNIIRIANNTSGKDHFLYIQILKISGILFLTISLIILLIYFRSKKLVKPIRHLIEKAKIIADGNYRERANVEGNNEIALLAENLNKMVSNIEERNHMIEEQSEFLYQANRKLNEAYKLLDHQKSLIENKQDDLTASINYAQRIQDSLLPKSDDFAKLFENSFLFYMPRDIVSGDFYWYSKIKNKIVVVVSDCTGHGVPGAFMSMIGMTILHHLVNHEHLDDPAMILTRLDHQICDLLIYTNSTEQRFEGMDTAVCCIDLDAHEMKFASAQRPIILMRKGEAITYKGSIYPIGEYYDNIQKIFTNTHIKLEEGDVIYMFSDGYTSQFEESGEKKFNYRRFRKLLTDINHRPLKEQPMILHRTLEAWKGRADQIDDILVLGFKYTLLQERKTFSAKAFLEGEI